MTFQYCPEEARTGVLWVSRDKEYRQRMRVSLNILVQRPKWLDRVGEKDSATLQGNPSETYKEVNLNILGQLCNECLPSDLYPQTRLQPGAWLSAVNHTLSPLLLPPNLLPQGQNPSRGPLEVGRLMFSALIRNGDPRSRIER